MPSTCVLLFHFTHTYCISHTNTFTHKYTVAPILGHPWLPKIGERSVFWSGCIVVLTFVSLEQRRIDKQLGMDATFICSMDTETGISNFKWEEQVLQENKTWRTLPEHELQEERNSYLFRYWCFASTWDIVLSSTERMEWMLEIVSRVLDPTGCHTEGSQWSHLPVVGPTLA